MLFFIKNSLFLNHQSDSFWRKFSYHKNKFNIIRIIWLCQANLSRFLFCAGDCNDGEYEASYDGTCLPLSGIPSAARCPVSTGNPPTALQATCQIMWGLANYYIHVGKTTLYTRITGGNLSNCTNASF